MYRTLYPASNKELDDNGKSSSIFEVVSRVSYFWNLIRLNTYDTARIGFKYGI